MKLESGISSRASLVCKFTYPQSHVAESLSAIRSFYVSNGYPLPQVQRALTRSVKSIAHVLQQKSLNVALSGLLCVSKPATKAV